MRRKSWKHWIKSRCDNKLGVDIMVQRTNDSIPQAVVCELNTAPTLNSSPHVMDRYTKLISKLSKSDTRIEHWDFEQFNNPKSLAWKEEQML